MIRPLRKPLVVMSPKSLLRHKLAVSSLDELATGRFRTVLDETENLNPEKVRRILLCSGKVCYDLLERRQAEKSTTSLLCALNSCILSQRSVWLKF